MEQQQQRSWSHLADLCLLLVFMKLPLCCVITSVGRVCTNWGRVQREELRRRKSLVMVGYCGRDTEESLAEELRQLDSPYESNLITHVRRIDGSTWIPVQPSDQILFNVLRVHCEFLLTESFITPLMNELPNITHLTLHLSFRPVSAISTLKQVTRLINYYATNLVSLKMGFYRFFLFDLKYKNPNDTATLINALFDSINRLESLRHLTLDLEKFYDDFQLSILSRLATFTCNRFSPVEPLLAALRQYPTTGDDLRAVECWAKMPLDQLIQLDPQLASKFTRVRTYFTESDSVKILQFCQRFVSLHSLGLKIWQMRMTVLSLCLSQLPELVNLNLKIESIHNNAGEEVDEEEVEPQITSVPSVRLLTLNIITCSHEETELLHLAQIFLNLQVLHLNHYLLECEKCGFNEEIQYVNHEKIVHCMRLAWQPFRLCAHLHTIKIDAQESAEFRSLLPQGLITRDQL